MPLIAILILLIFPSYGGQCGFSHMANYQRQMRQGALAKLTSRAGTCAPEDLYDTVHIRTTNHFRILYTLSGPHALPQDGNRHEAIVDSLALWLEGAWALHTQTLGMRPPLGMAVSHHYQDNRFPDKYPVELIDIGLMRNTWEMLGGPCGACYGITMPDPADFHSTTLIIDNDFFYQNSSDPLTLWPLENGHCYYTQSERPIIGNIQGQSVDYTENWQAALKITANHELYHACQLRYQFYEDQFHFWFEASATGVEDVAVPQGNDYFQYLDPIFNESETSILDTWDPYRPYAQSVFYHSLRNRFGNQFDHGLWTRLEQRPTIPIESHMDEEFLSLGVNGGLNTVLHDHAKHLVFSGTRVLDIDPDSIWHPDLPYWPNMDITTNAQEGQSFQPFSFRVYQYSAENRNLLNRSGLTVSQVQGQSADYLVASTAYQSVTLSTANMSQVAKSWPNPWKPRPDQTSYLYFDPVSSAKQVFIRSRSGQLVQTLTRTDPNQAFRWNGIVQGVLLRPGVYYWNTPESAKTHRFIVIR